MGRTVLPTSDGDVGTVRWATAGAALSQAAGPAARPSPAPGPRAPADE